MLAPVTILILPFMQVGFSYYASVALVACFAGAGIAIYGAKKIDPLYVLISAFLAALMISSASLQLGSTSQETLRSGREALCFITIIAVLNSRPVLSNGALGPAINAVLAISILLFLITVAQTFFLAQKVYFGIPKEYFVMNAGTLPESLDLMYSRIRPTGTFGEPSYLSAFCMSMVLAISEMWTTSKTARTAIILLTATAYLSLSMLGAISMSIVIFIIIFESKSKALTGMIVSVTALATPIIFTYFIDSLMLSRVERIFNGNDVSANARIFNPILFLPDYISQYPFGAPINAIANTSTLASLPFSIWDILHNGMFNIVFSYGIIGIVMIAMLFFCAWSKKIKFFFFVLLFQNGDMLSIDKVALIIVVVTLHRTCLQARRIATAQRTT